MSDDIKTILGIDTKEFQYQIGEANKVLETHNQKVKDLTLVMQKYDKDGKVAEQRFKTITDAGKEATVILSNFAKATEKTEVKIKGIESSEVSIRKFMKSLKEVSKEIAKGLKEQSDARDKEFKEFEKEYANAEKAERKFSATLIKIQKELTKGLQSEAKERAKTYRDFEKEYANAEKAERKFANTLIKIQKELTKGLQAEAKERAKAYRQYEKEQAAAEKAERKFANTLIKIQKELTKGLQAEAKQRAKDYRDFEKEYAAAEKAERKFANTLIKIQKELTKGLQAEAKQRAKDIADAAKATDKAQADAIRAQRKAIENQYSEQKRQAKDADKAEAAAIRNRRKEIETYYAEQKRLAKEADKAEADLIRAQRKEVEARFAALRQGASERERQILRETRLELSLQQIRQQGAQAALQAQQRAAAVTQERAARGVQIARNDSANIAGNFFASQLSGGANLNRASASELTAINGAINRITTDIARGRASLADYQTAFRAISGGTINQLSQQHQRLAANLLNLSERYAAVGQTGSDSAESVLLSWRGVVRLFAVQALHQSLNALLGLFKSNADEAARFSVAIGEIQTISQQTNVTYGQLNNQLLITANRFGVAPLDAAAAAYEAISNQVVDAANAQSFLTESLKFAAVTQTDAKTATNLLSSALNSYKIKATEAERVSAVFFEVINLGRVRAEEMGDTFGRVGTLAAQMGITLEEVGASITVLTRQGVRYSEAYTLINNVVLKLLKPTGEFKDLLNEYGFASGEAAIKTIGFGNVLQILDKEASKGNARLGELLDEMRAIRGAIGLTGEGFKEFNKDLSQIKGAEAVDRYRHALDLVNATAGKEFLINTQQIKTYFTDTFGNAFINTFNSVIKMFGSGGNAAREFLAAMTGLATATVTYLSISTALRSHLVQLAYQYFIVGVQMRNAAGQALSFGTAVGASLSTGNLVLAGITVAVGLLAREYFNASSKLEDLKNNSQRIYDSLAQNREKYMQNIRDSLKEESDAYAGTLNTIIGVVGQANATILSDLNKRAQQLSTAYKNVAKETEEAFDKVTDVIKDKVKNIENEIDAFIDKSNKAFDKFKDIQSSIPKTAFQQRVGNAPDDASKILLLQEEFKKLQEESNKLFESGNLDGAAEKLEELKSVGEQLAQVLTHAFKDAGKEAEKAFKEAAKAGVAASNAEADAQLKIASELEQQLKSRSQAGTLTVNDRANLQRKIDTANEQAQKAKDAAARGNAAQNNQTNFETLRLQAQNDILNVLKQQRDVYERMAILNAEAAASKERELATLQKQQEALNNAFKKLTDIKVNKDNQLEQNGAVINVEDIKAQFDNARELINRDTTLTATQRLQALSDLSNLEEAALKQAANTKQKLSQEEQQKQLIDIKKFYEDKEKALNDDLLKEEQRLAEQNSIVIASSKTLIEQLTEARNVLRNNIGEDVRDGAGVNPETLAKLKQIEEGLKQLRTLTDGETLNPAKFAALAQALQTVANIPIGTVFGNSSDKTKIFIDEISRLNEVIQKGINYDNIIEQQEELRISLKSVEDQLKTQMPAAFNTFTASATAANKSFYEQLGSVEQKLRQIIALQAEVHIDASHDLYGPQFNFGGRMFFASGGRGMDRIPAMLRADEFVMNAAATRRNFSQFQALNAGHTPRNFNSGGSVTNVGDVNVTVVGGDSSQATIREIGDGLRRQMRLNRFKF